MRSICKECGVDEEFTNHRFAPKNCSSCDSEELQVYNMREELELTLEFEEDDYDEATINTLDEWTRVYFNFLGGANVHEGQTAKTVEVRT